MISRERIKHPMMRAHIFDNIDTKNLANNDLSSIRNAILEYGVVCIKNQTLAIPELIRLTNLFGKAVKLPAGLRFNNTLDQYPELARISNTKTDGTVIKEHKAAEYWHVDGDFWQPGENYIYNFLHSIQVPSKGGETGFADLRRAYARLDDELKREISHLRFISSCSAIPDFKQAKAHEHLPDAYHPIKHTHEETGETGLYINYSTTPIEGMSEAASHTLLARLFEVIASPHNTYIHRWEKGDLLIWDNTRVMHRSMGGYDESPRLLYRTQAFMQSAATPSA